MANDHYVSRFLTKSWEVGQRRPHYYDLGAGKFGECSSESLFALDGLHSENTGQLLNEFIESPVSRHRAEILRMNGEIPPIDDRRLYRALASLILLQVQRDMDVHNAGVMRYTLDELAAKGEALFDTIASIAQQKHELIQVALGSGTAPLFFTEAVYFPIPMVSAAPILAVPLTPRHFVALPEKGFSENELERFVNNPMMVSAFSLGFGPWSKRVVIPPECLAARDADPGGFATMIREQQVRCRKVFNLVGKMAQVVGLRSFIVKEHFDEDVAEAQSEAEEWKLAPPGPNDFDPGDDNSQGDA